MLARERAEPAKPVAGGLRVCGRGRHRREAANPVVEVVGDLGRRDAALRRLAGEVHLDERRHLEPLGRGVRVERVDELADPVDDLHLVRLQAPDEVPAERIAVLGVLRLEVLDAVLADDLDAGLGEHAHLLEGHVLRRRDDRHARADLGLDPLVALANLSRR